MKNNIVRLLSAVLSLALLPACLLCACKPGSNGGDTTPAEESTGTPEPRLLTVVDKGEAKLEECIPLMRNLNRSAQQDGGNDEAGSIGGKT